jgi:hypothetical protein
MKVILIIVMLLFTQFANAQFGIDDSLITNSVSFNNLISKMNKIDSRFSTRDSITYSIHVEGKWHFICSYKKGWHEIIAPSTDSTFGKTHRQEFNNIRISRKDSTSFTTNELKKIFYLNDSRFIKDTSGNILSSPMVMTKNEKYLIIGLESYYPNGNQTSWDYRYNFYFKRQE